MSKVVTILYIVVFVAVGFAVTKMQEDKPQKGGGAKAFKSDALVVKSGSQEKVQMVPKVPVQQNMNKVALNGKPNKENKLIIADLYAQPQVDSPEVKSLKEMLEIIQAELNKVYTVQVAYNAACEYDKETIEVEASYIHFKAFMRGMGSLLNQHEDIHIAVENLPDIMELLKNIASADTFPFKPVIQALLRQYDTIKATDNWQNMIEGMSAHHYYTENYNVSNRLSMSKCMVMSLANLFGSDAWVYSFWLRRHLEGNMEQTHLLLETLNNIASKNFYTEHEDKLFLTFFFEEMKKDKVKPIEPKSYANIDLAMVPKDGEFLFSAGIGDMDHAIGSKVYIYTPDIKCDAMINKVWEDDDAAGGGGLAQRVYTVALDEASLCRGKGALVSYVESDVDLGQYVYSQSKMSDKEAKQLREYLVQDFPAFKVYKMSVEKLVNRKGSAFYSLKFRGVHALFRVQNEHVLILDWINNFDSTLLYWEESAIENYKGFQDTSFSAGVVADINENGFPEVRYDDGNGYGGGGSLLEVGTRVNIKTLSQYSD